MRCYRKFGAVVMLCAAATLLAPAVAQEQCQYCPITGLPIGSRGQTPTMFGSSARRQVTPPVNTVPRLSAPTATNRLPAANTVPQKSPSNLPPPKRIVGPTGRTEANGPGHGPPSGNVAPPRNVVPVNVTSSPTNSPKNSSQATSTKPPKQPVKTQPPRNSPFSRSVVKLTPANVEEMKRQLDEHQSKLFDRLIKAASGNPKAQEAINRLRNHVQNGVVTGKDIADVVAAVLALPSAEREAALRDLAGIVTDEQVSQWLDGVQAGMANGQPSGNANSPGQLAGGRNGGGDPGARGTGNNTPQGGRNPAAPGGNTGRGPDNVAGGPTAGRNPVGGQPPIGPGPNAGNPNMNVNIAIGAVPGLPAGLIIPLGGFGGGGGLGGGGFGGGPALVGMGQGGDQIAMGTGDPADMAGFPEAPPDAVPAPGAPPTPPSFGDIVLVNAGSGPISYTVNSEPFTMQPEEEQTLPSGTQSTVEFDRGNGRGTAQYSLITGTYEFRADENGWDLFQKSFDTTIDNSENPTPFGFVVDNQPQMVQPGESQRVTSRYPPIVRFDDGTGEIKARQLDGSNFRVAMNGKQQLDIYPADAFAASKQLGGASPPQVPGDATVTVSAAPTSTTLPPGFRMFDPVEAITKSEVGLSLPADFSLFRSAAAELAKQDLSPALSPVQ